MDKTRTELLALCKERGIKGCSNKTKEALIRMLETSEPVTEPTHATPLPETTTELHSEHNQEPLREEIWEGDCLKLMQTLPDHSAQIVIADPPYNIGKDFGNDSDKMTHDAYLKWCDAWIAECLRILKPNGTMFVFGFSEGLAHILTRIPARIHRRWLVWHYTNKNVASLNFWQRSHESILVLWKEDPVFHRDAVREPYSETFLNNAAGKERPATKGRFSKGDKKTTYTAHPQGALPRDVLKIPALAGGAGAKERVNHPTQKPLALCERLLKSCQQKQSDGFVLVPFAGSGSECVAAKRLGLPYIGIELNPDYVKLMRERLFPVIESDVEGSTEDHPSESGVPEPSEPPQIHHLV
jgi:site-specific DNA-methyltransferase (adenine-specific)